MPFSYSRVKSEHNLVLVLNLSLLLIVKISKDLRKLSVLYLWRTLLVNILLMLNFRRLSLQCFLNLVLSHFLVHQSLPSSLMLFLLQLLELSLSLEEVNHLVCHDICFLVDFKSLAILKNLGTLNSLHLLSLSFLFKNLVSLPYLHLILEFSLLLNAYLLGQDFFVNAISDDLVTFLFKLLFLRLENRILLSLVLIQPIFHVIFQCAKGFEFPLS